MTINELAKRCHDDAKSLGWYDKDKQKSDLETLMMVVSEVCEAVEELRKKDTPVKYYIQGSKKPEGWGVEIADAIIRLLDMSAFKGLDIEEIINEKLEYNLTRGYRHGGKKY